VAEKIPDQKRDTIYLVSSAILILNIGAALSGYYFKLPEKKIERISS